MMNILTPYKQNISVLTFMQQLHSRLVFYTIIIIIIMNHIIINHTEFPGQTVRNYKTIMVQEYTVPQFLEFNQNILLPSIIIIPGL